MEKVKLMCRQNGALTILILGVLITLIGLLATACGGTTTSTTASADLASSTTASTSAPSDSTELITLNMVSFLPPSDSFMVGVHMFVDEVNTRMAGRLEINYQGGPEVIPGLDQPKAVVSGAVDGAFTVTGYYTNLVPVGYLKVATGVTPSEQRETGFYDLFNEQHKKAGLYFLGSFSGYSPFYYWLKDPIANIADFNGLLIRSGGIQDPFTIALGAKPTVIPLGDVYTALQTGVVEGATAGMTSGEQWVEVAPYVVEPGFYGESQPDTIIFNLARWDGLPEDIKQELIAIVIDYEPAAYEATKENTAKTREKVDAKGAKWIQLPADEEAQYVKMSREAIFDFVSKQPEVTTELMDQFRAVMPGVQ